MMRSRTAVILVAYLVLGAVWIYWAIDRAGPDVSGDRAWLLATLVVHAAAAFAIGRGWTVGLPLTWVLLAMPAGRTPDDAGDIDQAWVVQALTLHFDIAAALLGYSLRKLIASVRPTAAPR